MKAKNMKLSVLGIATLGCFSLGMGLTTGDAVYAQANQTTVFECPGASIRMNKQDGLNGIRFPMFMDNATFNDLTSNATIQNEDVTFGTLIIPTDKLTGSLTVDTALAKNLVTYGYNEEDKFVNVWTDCTDENYPDCMQGYAYIHTIPDTSLDRNLTAVGYYTVDGGENYVYTKPIERHVSYVADKAIQSGEYSEAQVTKLHDFLANYTVTFEMNSEIATQQIKYGKTITMPAASISTPVGSTLEWYDTASGLRLNTGAKLTATKNAAYKLQAVENVQYTTTVYNKENIFKGDPSVTYKDGYYYSIHEDAKGRLWVAKSASLEEILEGGASGWGHSGRLTCVYEPKEGDELGAEVWAPELTYIQGKWYIYVCGVAYGTNRGDGNNMKMFVLECESQDPTGEWKDPVRLYPKGFDNYYTIDGHAFEYNGQLYYVFSGQKEGWLGSIGEDRRPLLYMTKMSSPTACTNDTPVCISKGSDLEEGPCTIVDGNDVYLMYSAGTWNGGDYNNANDYHLEYYKLTGTNLLKANSWTEMGTCLEHDASKDVYAVGHNHIFKNADGSLWTSYHGIVGTEGAGTSEYLAKRRTMVQPISIENGELNFGGIQDEVVITDKAGLQYNNAEKTEYLVDGYGAARLWANDGKSFQVSTTITNVGGGKDYCAGVTLYERQGDGTLSKLLIGVEEEGNVFFCKDYMRIPLYYKYADGTWQWGESAVANLKVTYMAGDSTATSTIAIEIANGNRSKSKTSTYTLDEINALVSGEVSGDTMAFDLHFTGDFEIGLGGNQNKCTFTNVSFEEVITYEAEVEDFTCDVADAYNYSFEASATFKAPNPSENMIRMGFDFTTGEQASYLRLVCIANWNGQYRIGIQGFDNDGKETSAWEKYDLSELNLSDTITLKVVYDGNRNIRVFINGVEKKSDIWNTTTVKGVSALSFCGTSTANDRATLTVSPYSNLTKITGFECVQGEMPTDKMAIGENIYWSGEHSMKSGVLSLQGGYLLEEAMAPNGDAFVAEATFTMQGVEVGFVVDSDKEGRYTSIIYKPSDNKFMFYTDDWNYNVTGIVNLTQAYASGDKVRMTLVYNNKSYTIFMDGKLACVINENDTCNDTYSSVKGKYSIKEMIGTGENVYVGLLSTNKASTYTDWWYSADMNVVEEYVGTYMAEVSNFAADVTDGYNNGFEASATFKAPNPNESMIRMGFDFTTGENASFLRLVCIANWSGQYRIGIQGFDNNHTETSAWVRYDMSDLNLSSTVTLKVIYDGNRNLRVFINGVEKSDAMWNTTTVKSLSALSFCGTSTANDRATLTITPYADRTEITGFNFTQGTEYVPVLTEAAIKNFVCDVSGNYSSSMNDPSDNNPHFEVSATFNANSSTASKKLMGFEFTTGEGNKLVFAYAINWNGSARMGFKALDANGNEICGRWYNVNKTLDLSKANTIRVVYDGNRNFYVYVTPEGGSEFQITATDGRSGSQFNLGWGLGADGSKGLPLSYAGTSTLNNRMTLFVKPFTDYPTDIEYSNFACKVTGGYQG